MAEESEMSEKKWEGELEPEFGIDLFNACMVSRIRFASNRANTS